MSSWNESKLASNASFSKSRKKSDWGKRQQKIVRGIDHFFEKWETQNKLDEENSEFSADRQQSQKEIPNTSEKSENLFKEYKAIENLLENHKEIAEES